jgi:dolichol-phosphate mannosyltransferase
MAQRALVTGAGGFVGANLCRRLMRDGHEVHALVKPGGTGWRLDDVRRDLLVHEVELRDVSALDRVLDAARPDWIFHLAAYGAYSWQGDIDQIFAINTIATANLVELLCARGFEAFVQAGSSSEYGFKDHPPDELEWIEPNSAYAVSKAAATHYVRFLARKHEQHIVTLRLYSVYGPWEEPNRLLPTLAMYGLSGRLPALADPRTARDFVFVDDVCDAFTLAASATALDPGTVLNVGSGVQTSLSEVVELARNQLSLLEEPRWASMAARDWDTSVWVANGSRIQTTLDWRPRWTLQDGFRALVEWLRGHPSTRDRYGRAIGLVDSR